MSRIRLLIVVLLLVLAISPAYADDVLLIPVVTAQYPLTLENTRTSTNQTVLWGSAIIAGETLDITATLQVNGSGGLILDDNRDNTPPLYVGYDGSLWRVRLGTQTVFELPQLTDSATFSLSVADGTHITLNTDADSYTETLPDDFYEVDDAVGLSALLSAGASLTISELSITGAPMDVAGEGLAALAGDMTIGTALDIYPPTHDPHYEALLRNEVNLIAPTDFYWTTSRTPDQGFDLMASDAWVNFAQVNDKRVRGYHLIWDFELPNWLDDASPFERAQALREHVGTIVGRYRGHVHEWVVVNEAIWGSFDTGEPTSRYAENLWLDAMDDGYIELAFRVADAADPDAILIYNETGAEAVNSKSDYMYAMILDFIERGVPIDGAGLQMHIDAATPPDVESVIENMERFTALGVGVYLTEMDVNVAHLDGTPEEKAMVQAHIYRDMLAACRMVVGCHSYTIWSLSDHYAWYEQEGGAESPALFDMNYEPKPAYALLLEWLIERGTREARAVG